MPVSTAVTVTYSTTQMSSEMRIPRGIVFCGLIVSCAVVTSASNPIYAKNTTAAPRNIPLHPKCPNSSVFSGIYGTQLEVSTYDNPEPINSNMTITFTTTNTLFSLEEFFVPSRWNAVSRTMMQTAGKLMIAPVRNHPSFGVCEGALCEV